MATYRVRYDHDTITVTLGGPSDPILVDGREIGLQGADGSCRTPDCIRLAAAATWPEAGDFADGSEAWDELSYEPADARERIL